MPIPGHERILSARGFVEWYNSHPDSLPTDFRGANTLGIIGNGNVAIDIARILGCKIDRLEATEINSELLEIKRESNLREINLIARRGAI